LQNANFNKIFIIIAVAAVLLLPAYIIFSLSPSFTRLLIDSKETEGMRVAQHMATMYLPEDQPLDAATVRRTLAANDTFLRREFQLMKLKLFSAGGEVLYSTDPADIGTINRESYFTTMVARGKPYTKAVRKNAPSLEHQIVTADVVETYLPIMREGRFVGAFEIYYDFSATLAEIDRLTAGIHAVLFVISTAFLLAILITGVKAHRNNVERRRAAHEKELLIAELREAIGKVKTLRGFLPICSSCKKIRDDKGYWEQIETYIRDHSEVELSHSICPECARKLYPNLYARDGREKAGDR